jgi:hypothetical protein
MGPGWWLASDGRWYPPQPTPKPSNSRVWIAVLAVVAVVLTAVGVGGYVLFRAATGDRATADIECPPGDFVGEQLNSAVFGPTDADMLVMSGCHYGNNTYDVYIWTGITLASEDAQINAMVDEGEEAGADVRTIDVGDAGRVWASNTKGYAIAIGADGLISVEVESKDASVPDLSDPVVAILKRVLR